MGYRHKNKKVTTVIPGIKRITSKFWPQISKQKLLLGGSLLAIFGEVSLQLLEPWPLKFIFDRILVSESDIGSVHLVLGQEVPPLVLLSGLTLAIVAIALLRAFATYISKLSMAMVAVRVLAEIRSQLYSHLQRLSLSFHNQYKRGDLISRVTADIENIRNGTIDAIVPFAINTVALVGMIVVMFFINWELAAIALILFPVFLFVANNLIARIRRSVRKHRQSEGLIASTTSDTIGAIKIVQALSLHNALERMFLEQNRNNLDLGTESLKISALLLRTVQVLVAMTIAIVLWRGAILVIDKSLSPGDLLVFISYLKNSFEPPLRKFANQTGAIAKTIASGERVVDILEYEPNVRNLPKAKEAHPFFGAVRFKNVKFGYEANREILRDLNFEVEAGQKITIVGPSGSGKSTLMSLMLRLYDPVRGSILIDGQDLREYTLESLRSQISVVLQDSCLFAASIKENIAYGNLQASQKEIEKAASLANAHEFILNLPQGYDTILGEGGASLSGGQRQRIAIARAAIRQAPIAILDEPTTGLDNVSKIAVMTGLERLTEGRTTFLITHDLQMVEETDLIVYLEKGKILEYGTHEELMSLGQRYATLYQLESAIADKRLNNGDSVDPNLQSLS